MTPEDAEIAQTQLLKLWLSRAAIKQVGRRRTDRPGPVIGQGQGFACLSPVRRRDIARRGGLAVHARRRAYQWTAEAAREAGRKGGLERARRRRLG